MNIKQVRIVEGSEVPVGDGATQPNRALIRFEDTTTARAIIKKLDLKGFSAEIFCAALCRSWGLDVPEVAIVIDREHTIASLDVGYPNLKQQIGWSEDLPSDTKEALVFSGAKLVSTFSSTPMALAVDEAINNRDRNLGNILWDGNNAAWIDHERSLGFDGMPDVNKLATMSILSGNDEKMKQAALAISLAIAADVANEVASKVDYLEHSEEFRKFVVGRVKKLGNMVLDRFPRPPDLLTNI